MPRSMNAGAFLNVQPMKNLRTGGADLAMEERQKEKIHRLAEEVMRLSRNMLMVNLRFMDSAISKLELVSDEEEASISVDGQRIRYNPVFILQAYQEEKGLVVRQYLHMILHCVFQHAFVDRMRNQEYWDLACDIAVENVINELELPGAAVSQTIMQQAEISHLKQHVKYMTAEVLYRCFMEGNVPDEELKKIMELFKKDDHEVWYEWIKKDDSDKESSAAGEYAEENLSEEQGETDQEGTEASLKETETGTDQNHSLETETESDQSHRFEAETGSDQSHRSETEAGSDQSHRSETEQESKSEPGQKAYIELSPEEIRKMWKDVSQQMQIDLETFSRERGSMAGGMTQNLMAVNRESYDYSSFLKKFSVLGEAVRINDDEFDYIFYTYGLQMYGKMPLVEPLEYKEVKKIKEFVIALDTSGSTSCELVQKFVQKTYNILKQQENFFTKINLHIIQCDAEIQEDAKITSQEEFDEYLEHMQIRGLAGTDFRPVFSYVEYLMEKHEFTNLKGLIYFTDGFGVFPKKQPPYQTAIVYLDEGYENPQVPVWAIKLVLTPEEI